MSRLHTLATAKGAVNNQKDVANMTRTLFSESDEFVARIRRLIELRKKKLLLERGNIGREANEDVAVVIENIKAVVNSIPEESRQDLENIATFFIKNSIEPEDARIFNLM